MGERQACNALRDLDEQCLRPGEVEVIHAITIGERTYENEMWLCKEHVAEMFADVTYIQVGPLRKEALR